MPGPGWPGRQLRLGHRELNLQFGLHKVNIVIESVQHFLTIIPRCLQGWSGEKLPSISHTEFT